MDIDWSKAPEGTTHYCELGQVFMNLPSEDACHRCIPRPQKAEVEWDRETPHVGWHGECTWGGKAVWFECVILPNERVAKDRHGEWEVVDLNRLRAVEFRSIRTKEQRLRNEVLVMLDDSVREYNVNIDCSKAIMATVESIISLYNLEPKDV